MTSLTQCSPRSCWWHVAVSYHVHVGRAALARHVHELSLLRLAGALQGGTITLVTINTVWLFKLISFVICRSVDMYSIRSCSCSGL